MPALSRLRAAVGRVRWWMWAALVAAVPATGVAGLAGMLWWYGRDLASIDEAALRGYKPPQITRIYASDGETLLGEYFKQRRTFIRYEDIPSHVEDAFLAAEDADFYRHEGLDYLGILRALMINVRAGRVRQGASTITQQVVKNFILSPERTFKRKVHELLLARRLERVLSKREILELYLNEIYLGHGRYGIQEASRFYFGRDVQAIDVGQAAVLATLPKAPGASTPHKAPEKVKQRQVYVLEQMSRHGFLAPSEVRRFIDAPLAVVPLDEAGSQPFEGAAAFVDAVLAQLKERFGPDLSQLGATVITTLDPEIQKATRAGLRAQLQTIDVRQRFAHDIRPSKERALKRARTRGARVRAVGQIGPVIIERAPTPDETSRPGFVGKLGDATVFVEVPAGSRYDEPERSLRAQFPPGGITVTQLRRPPRELTLPEGWLYGEIASGPEAVMLVAEIETGDVVAMVAGYDTSRGGFNRAMEARRQPGSTFKPFVYGAAIESQAFTAGSIVIDSPEIYEKWRPTNFERDRYRGEIRLREALTHSVNTVAIKLLDAVGTEVVSGFARRAGIQSPLSDNLSLALGTSEVTPFELMEAYATLARSGRRRAPRLIRRIEFEGGEIEVAPKPLSQAIAPEVAFVVASMMESVVQFGTGRRARVLGPNVAGKTGTAAENRDAWFAGFTSRHVGVAWVGFDRPKSLGRKETGGRAALPIWVDAMRAAQSHAGPDALPRAVAPPTGIEVRTIDRARGILAAADASPSEVLEEFFVRGTAPTERVVTDVLDLDALALELLVPGTSTGDGTSPAQPMGDDAVPRTSTTPREPPPLPPPDEAAGRGGALPSVLDAP